MQVYYSKRSFRLHSSQQSLPRKNGASCISFSLSLLSLSITISRSLGWSTAWDRHRSKTYFHGPAAMKKRALSNEVTQKFGEKCKWTWVYTFAHPFSRQTQVWSLKKTFSVNCQCVFFTQNRHHCFQAAHDILAAQVEEIWAAASGCKTQGIWRIINAVEHHWHRTYGIDQLGHITVYWKTYLKTPLSFWTTIFKYI